MVRFSVKMELCRNKTLNYSHKETLQRLIVRRQKTFQLKNMLTSDLTLQKNKLSLVKYFGYLVACILKSALFMQICDEL